MNPDCSKGMDFLKQAVEADRAGRLNDALSMYLKGLEYFLVALRMEKNPRTKHLVNAKLREYLSRAEQIKQQLYARSSTIHPQVSVTVIIPPLCRSDSGEAASSSSSSVQREPCSR